jgi:LysR family transcriptional regulator of gallate degradation
MTTNVRHLHAFHEVARLGSTSAAAHRVHLTQPAVTQAVAGLERYFGAALFTRSSAGMRLTRAGEICAERIERALTLLREGVADLKRNAGADARDAERLARLVRTPQLEALIALVDHRNFTRAARASRVSQPTMHRAARELERTLRAPLFEKTSFGVVPTRDAEKLARRARLAFTEISQARADIAALNGHGSGATVIGAMPLARSFLVPNALIEFTREHPDHRVSIMEGTYEHLLAALHTGEADFLIGALRDAKLAADIVQEHLFDDPLSIIVRAGHPLARRKRLTAADLSRHPWIAPRASSPLRARFDALFARAGVSPPEKAIECNSLIAARALLMESDRMMLLSAHQIHYERSAGMLAALPHPAGVVTRPIGLTMRRDWRPTRAQMRLLALVREMSHRRLGMTAGVQRKASPRRARPARRRTTSVSSSL